MNHKYLWLVVIGFVLIGFQIWNQVMVNYEFENKYLQYWQLSDKSSTIQAKQQYISQFVTALETGYDNHDFSKHDAVWLTTPNNGFDQNLQAVKSLQHRLTEIQDMDPTSFQYNTAIEQITKQEQGEAGKMIGVFKGCYTLKSHPMVWAWIGGILAAFEILLVIVGWMVWLES